MEQEEGSFIQRRVLIGVKAADFVLSKSDDKHSVVLVQDGAVDTILTISAHRTV